MKFIIISKAHVQNFPRIISLASSAKEIDYEVEIITQNILEDTQTLLSNMGIQVSNIKNKVSQICFRKVWHWYRFARFANGKYLKMEKDSIIWITGADTAICMGLNVLKKRNFYFQINELYDLFPNYLKNLKKISQYAQKIIVPEKNRAAIFQVWFRLKETPYVLPNKPFFDETLISKGNNLYKEYIEHLTEERKKGKKILLYQGHLIKDRNLSQFLNVTKEFKNILVVLMGYDHGIIENYRQIDPSLYYIPSIPAPFHLSITSCADLGLLVYLPESLNNIYCAPNKIWEYSKYGLALIGNNIVGLEMITSNQIGIQCNIENIEDIKNKLSFLLTNLDFFKKNSLQYFENINYMKIFMDIIDK